MQSHFIQKTAPDYKLDKVKLVVTKRGYWLLMRAPSARATFVSFFFFFFCIILNKNIYFSGGFRKQIERTILAQSSLIWDSLRLGGRALFFKQAHGGLFVLFANGKVELHPSDLYQVQGPDSQGFLTFFVH